MVTSPCDTDATDSAALARLADGLIRRGWALPAAIVLDVLRPFGFLCGQALLVLEPLVGRSAALYGELLAKPARLEELLTLLERSRSATDDAEGG